MYRHNQLKEELDKLRSENDYFKLQIRYLNEKLARRDLEIKNLQLQFVVKVDDDAMPPEPFKTGVDTGIPYKQVYTATEIANDAELCIRKACRDYGIPDYQIDEIFNNMLNGDKWILKDKSE